MFCSKCGKEIDGNSKFCEACGAAIDQATQSAVSSEVAKENSKNKRMKFKDLPKKKKITRIVIAGVCFLLAFILIIGDSSGGSDVLTEPADNDNGATFTMDLDEFSERFDDVNNVNNFLVGYWGKDLPSATDYEELSGQKFTNHFAVLENITIAANIQNDKLASVKVIFPYDDSEFGEGVGVNIVRICTNTTIEEAASIIDTVISGETTEDTVVYKNGVIVSLTGMGNGEGAWYISAASEEFAVSLEESGSCNVIRM